jgi:hypothetical protein
VINRDKPVKNDPLFCARRIRVFGHDRARRARRQWGGQSARISIVKVEPLD